MYRTDSELINVLEEKRCEKDGKDYREAAGLGAASTEPSGGRCPICTEPFIPHYVHGHLACTACGQTVEACCNGDVG